MRECKYCEELNTENQSMEVEEIYIASAGHFGYRCPIKYCPACGTKLNKYKTE